MTVFYPVANNADLEADSVLPVVVEGIPIVLIRLPDGVFALEDRCPHEGAPLSEGYIEGEDIVCLWHGSCFNARTGRVSFDPAEEDVKTFPVRIKDDQIEVGLPE